MQGLISDQEAIRKIDRSIVWLERLPTLCFILSSVITGCVLTAGINWCFEHPNHSALFFVILGISATLILLAYLKLSANLLLSAKYYAANIKAILEDNKEDLKYYYTAPQNASIRDRGSLLYWINKFYSMTYDPTMKYNDSIYSIRRRFTAGSVLKEMLDPNTQYDLSKYASNQNDPLFKICCSMVIQFPFSPPPRIQDREYMKFILLMALENNDNEHTLNQLKRLKTYLYAIPHLSARKLFSKIINEASNFDDYKQRINNVIKNIEAVSLLRLIPALHLTPTNNNNEDNILALLLSVPASSKEQLSNLINNKIKPHIKNLKSTEYINSTNIISIFSCCSNIIQSMGMDQKDTNIANTITNKTLQMLEERLSKINNKKEKLKYDINGDSNTLFVYATLITCAIFHQFKKEFKQKDNTEVCSKIDSWEPDFQEIIDINKKFRDQCEVLRSTIDLALELYAEQTDHQKSTKDSLDSMIEEVSVTKPLNKQALAETNKDHVYGIISSYIGLEPDNFPKTFNL